MARLKRLTPYHALYLVVAVLLVFSFATGMVGLGWWKTRYNFDRSYMVGLSVNTITTVVTITAIDVLLRRRDEWLRTSRFAAVFAGLAEQLELASRLESVAAFSDQSLPMQIVLRDVDHLLEVVRDRIGPRLEALKLLAETAMAPKAAECATAAVEYAATLDRLRDALLAGVPPAVCSARITDVSKAAGAMRASSRPLLDEIRKVTS